MYIKMWTVGAVGFAIGSQSVHSIYKPLVDMDLLVEQEVERLREERHIKKPDKMQNLIDILERDKEYIEKFNVKLDNKWYHCCKWM